MVTVEPKISSVSIPTSEEQDVNSSSPEEVETMCFSSSLKQQSPPTLLQCEVDPTKALQNQFTRTNSKSNGYWVLGVCALEKKTRSQPMKEILSRINIYNEFKIIIFSDDMIFNQPIEEWPVCDCLISFHSRGFPLSKAIKYVELRKPVCVNNLKKMKLLLDRSCVYNTLEQNNVPVPKYAVLKRNKDGTLCSSQKLKEKDDYIEVNGIPLQKPFVEKPLDAEDHHIVIYYPSSSGGGCRKLFRKRHNKSSVYEPSRNNVRTDQSYLYEEFLATSERQDLKVYSVGEYAFAETRKSPTVDGIVERDASGKERRQIVTLSDYEHKIAYTVVQAFEQFVCGFDILRTENNKSFVCDVNGWSFVKKQTEYYDECASRLRACLLEACKSKH